MKTPTNRFILFRMWPEKQKLRGIESSKQFFPPKKSTINIPSYLINNHLIQLEIKM